MSMDEPGSRAGVAGFGINAARTGPLTLLNFPFAGKDWEPPMVKLTLACAALMVIVPPVAEALELGYAYQVAKRVLVARADPAPPGPFEWKRLLVDGFRWLEVVSLFNIPALLVVVGTVAAVFWRYGSIRENSWPGLTEGWPILIGGLGFAILLSMIGGWLAQVAAMQIVITNSFWSVFHVRSWMRVLHANPGGFLRGFGFLWIFQLGLGLAQLILSIPAVVLIILPALIAAFFGIYQRMISAAVISLAFREGLDRLAQKDASIE